jgi:hypothetical protein
MATIPAPSGNSSFLTNGCFFSPNPPLAPRASEYSNLNMTSILRDIADDLFSLGNFTNVSTSALPPSATDLDTAITLVNELRSRVSQLLNAVALIYAAAHALKTTKG